MNQIIIGFSRPKAWLEPFSWLIRLVTWSPVSHAYIKFYSEEYQRWIIYQASGLKVNFIGNTLFNDIEYVYKEFEISISDETKLKTIQFAIDNCGLPYSILQAFGMLLVIIAKGFGRRIKNPFYSTSSYVCSELVSTVLDDFLENESLVNPGTATPQDLLEFFESKNFT